jgi:peptide deformylase
MSILKVARLGHPILRAKARKVDRREIRAPQMQGLVDEMIATMHEYRGIGLAAPQIHRDLRLFVVAMLQDGADANAGSVIALFNPELTVVGSEVAEDWEGCLSIPGIQGLVPRARSIGVAAMDREGNRIEFQARDLHARVIQHEYDHIDGVLFLDRMRDRTSLAYTDQASEPPRAF